MRKSTCCAAKVRRFSGRRRQCTACFRTWSLRSKRRGRKALKIDERLLKRVFIEQRSLTEIARRRGLTRQALSYRFLRVLESRFRIAQAQHLSGDDLILLADGLWFRFKNRPWVLYLLALRPVKAERATFIDPLLLEGPESKHGWQRALATIPSNRRAQVCALVGDNFKGSASIAAENSWVLQLCHFHLVAQLERTIGRRSSKLKARGLRREVYRFVRKALLTRDWSELRKIIYCLGVLIADPAMPINYRRAVRSYLRRFDEYHAYQAYPNLRLPRTNNTAEAMGRRIRDLMGRTRALSSPRSLQLWARQYVRAKPTIVCRPA